MNKYIDADILRVKITDLCTNANFYQQRAIEESNREDFVSSGGEISAYAKVLSLIGSLQHEQQEVDLKEEIASFFSKNPIPHEHITDWPLLKNTALHFFNLGLNARKKD